MDMCDLLECVWLVVQVLKTYLFNEQLLAHGDALVEPFLVFLKEFLLFVYLSPQVTVCLLIKDSRGDVV